MPLYDYVCGSCAHIVEVMHGVNAAGPTRCERCGGEMRKLISTPAIVFKGSGWAKNDRSTKPADKSKPSTDSETKPTKSADVLPAKSSTDKAASSPDA